MNRLKTLLLKRDGVWLTAKPSGGHIFQTTWCLVKGRPDQTTLGQGLVGFDLDRLPKIIYKKRILFNFVIWIHNFLDSERPSWSGTQRDGYKYKSKPTTRAVKRRWVILDLSSKLQSRFAITLNLILRLISYCVIVKMCILIFNFFY